MGQETCLPNPHLLAATRAAGGARGRRVCSTWHSASPVQNRTVQTLSEWQLMFIRLSLYAGHSMETGCRGKGGWPPVHRGRMTVGSQTHGGYSHTHICLHTC